MKQGFKFMFSIWEGMMGLEDAEKVKVIRSIAKYGITGEYDENDAYWLSIVRSTIDSNKIKRDLQLKKRAEKKAENKGE